MDEILGMRPNTLTKKMLKLSVNSYPKIFSKNLLVNFALFHFFFVVLFWLAVK